MFKYLHRLFCTPSRNTLWRVSPSILLIGPILLSFTLNTHAVDTIKMLSPLFGADKRVLHKNEVITRALELTSPTFGPYILESVKVDMTPNRALSTTKTGEIINLFIAPHDKVWQQKTIPIKIPIRQGLLSYRLLLVNKHKLHLYRNIDNINDLKRLTAGLQSDWVTTKIFKKLNFKLITSQDFEGLFKMLDKGRYDYFPRGIYEIYDEFDNRKGKLQNIVIEPNLALYLPTVTYIYVSLNEPRIARRIELGLSMMQENGELKHILKKYYSEDINRANLTQRKIISINTLDPENNQQFDMID